MAAALGDSSAGNGGFAPGTGVGTTFFFGEDTRICMLYRYKDTSSGLTSRSSGTYTQRGTYKLWHVIPSITVTSYLFQMKASFKAHISRCLLTDAASTLRYSASDVIWYRLGSQHVSNLGEGGLLSLKLTESASSLNK